MIKEIVYKSDVTIIKGENESIMTDELNLTDAFDFAKKNKAKFYKTSSTLEDLQDFSTYLAYKITKAPNRNIYLYFRKLYEAGINDILNIDSFIKTATDDVFRIIIEDYNEKKLFSTIEHGGADIYIARILNGYLRATQNKKDNNAIRVLVRFIEEDEYDLWEFYTIVKKLAQIIKEDEKKERIIKLKEKFNDEFGCSTQALDDYVGYLSTFGGDYTSYIADAFNKCFDALINNEPFCDRDGLIKYLGDKK